MNSGQEHACQPYIKLLDRKLVILLRGHKDVAMREVVRSHGLVVERRDGPSIGINNCVRGRER